ncbi:MAG: hypothetical protein PVI43_04795, partial [Candidatus Bathyarchaeota archaeon]
TTAPTCDISINNNNPYTTSTSVTLQLTYDDGDGSGVSQVRYQNHGGDWSEWEAPSATKAWTLLPGDGWKRVYYQVKDNVGNEATVSYDAITVDTTAPTGSIIIDGGATSTTSPSVTLSLTYNDENDISDVRYSNDGVFDTEAWETPTSTKAWVLPGGNGEKTIYYQVRDIPGITAQFQDTINLEIPTPPEYYNLTVGVSGSGSTSPSVGSHTYAEDSEVEVSASASSGWSFSHWMLDSVDVGSANPYTVTIDNNHNFVAVFTENPPTYYDLTIGISGSGSTSPSVGVHNYIEDSQVAVTASADSGYSFSHWTLDSTNVGSTNPYTVTMNNNHTLTAVFTETSTIYYDLTIDVIGSGTTSPAEGIHSYEEFASITVTAIPSSGWLLSNWIYDSQNLEASNPIILVMDDDHSLTAVFTEATSVLSYDLKIIVVGEGTVNPSAGVHTYENGTGVPISKTAAEGWSFSNYILNGEDIGVGPLIFGLTMIQDNTLIVIFTQDAVPTTLHDVIADQTLYVIGTCSNATVSDLTFNQDLGRIRFSATGTDGTTGFCNITIPSELMWGTFTIYNDDIPLIEGIDYTQTSNSTHYNFSITYEHSTHTIEIFSTEVIPELTSIIMLMTTIITSIVIKVYKKNQPSKETSKQNQTS